MRVLFIGFLFPPYNQIGAVRLGKFAKYFERAGHDVRVLCADRIALPATSRLEIDPARVIRTKWLNVNAPIELLLGGRERVVSRGYRRPGVVGRILSRLGRLYGSILHFPDGQVGWWPYAVRAGAALIKSWRPDIILVSAPPFTGLLVARQLASKHRIPWAADLRDLWSENQLRRTGRLRHRMDTWLERRVLSSAAGLVTVSAPLARRLAARHPQPVQLITNGFDPEDLPVSNAAPGAESQGLQLIYTGMVYEGFQDAAPLFEALRADALLRQAVRVDFYGRNLSAVETLNAHYGLHGCVRVHAPIGHLEALRLQRQADALLFLAWRDPEQSGIMTGKIFEYLGARRPILMLGLQADDAVRMVTGRGAGHLCRSADEIAAQLHTWLRAKAAAGRLEDTPPTAVQGLTRQEQAQTLLVFLQACLQAPHDGLAPRPG